VDQQNGRITVFRGTEVYAAPEQIRLIPSVRAKASLTSPSSPSPRRGYGKKVDSWGVGVVTFFVLGGYPPFLRKVVRRRVWLLTLLRNNCYLCLGRRFDNHDFTRRSRVHFQVLDEHLRLRETLFGFTFPSHCFFLLFDDLSNASRFHRWTKRRESPSKKQLFIHGSSMLIIFFLSYLCYCDLFDRPF
jgi:serine/threonine protein kinase